MYTLRVLLVIYLQDSRMYNLSAGVRHNVERNFEPLAKWLNQALELVPSRFEVVIRSPDNRLPVL